ncbi:hypothetical protein ES702_05883 [subsurface metagenome]
MLQMPGSPFIVNDVSAITQFRLESQRQKNIWFEDFQYNWNETPSNVLTPDKCFLSGAATQAFELNINDSVLKVDLSEGNNFWLYPHIYKDFLSINQLNIETHFNFQNTNNIQLFLGFLRWSRTAADNNFDYYLKLFHNQGQLNGFNGQASGLIANNNVLRDIHKVELNFTANVPVNLKYYINGVLVDTLDTITDSGAEHCPVITGVWNEGENSLLFDYIKVWGF